MAQNGSERRPAQTSPQKGMSDFRKALLFTAIPFVVLGTVSVGTAFAGGPSGIGIGIASMLWAAGIIVCVAFAIARQRQIALGMLAGLAIGLVGLGLTCFVPMIRD